MEIVSIIGDAAPTPGDGAGLHIHMGVAFADGTMHGGHLFETHVSPTMGAQLTASPIAVHRAYDETFDAWLLVPYARCAASAGTPRQSVRETLRFWPGGIGTAFSRIERMAIGAP